VRALLAKGAIRMIKLNFSLNNKQFAAFLATMHAKYPEFRHQTGGIPISRVQIAKNATQVQIKPLANFVLPGDVEETATKILENVLSDKTLQADGEFNYADINRRAAQAKRQNATQERRTMAALRAKRQRQEAFEISL
jgi:hypothetical protein